MDSMRRDSQTESPSLAGSPIPQIIALGAAIALFLVLLGYLKGIVVAPNSLGAHLIVIALLMGSLCLAFGFFGIHRGMWVVPKRRTLTVILFSTLVLSSFIAYYFFHGEITQSGNGAAQTNIAIPAASGGGVKLVLPHRFGMNMGSSTYYGNIQMTANLLSSEPYSPQIWNTTSTCASGTTTTWTDSITSYNVQPVNFFQTDTYQVISGADAGNTGTITSSTSGVSAQITFTASPGFTTGCTAGDVMILRCTTPLGACAGGYTPVNIAGALLSPTNGAGITFETSDLSPASSSIQGLQLSANTGITHVFDGSIPPNTGGSGTGTSILLNGTYTLTFRAKATSGTPTISCLLYTSRCV